VREALLAVEELAGGYREDVPALSGLIGGLTVARGGLDLLIGRVPGADDEHTRIELKLEAFGILRDLVSAELLRTPTDPESEAKRDGLLNVLGLIDAEIERVAEQLDALLHKQDAGAPSPPTTEWIEVES